MSNMLENSAPITTGSSSIAIVNREGERRNKQVERVSYFRRYKIHNRNDYVNLLIISSVRYFVIETTAQNAIRFDGGNFFYPFIICVLVLQMPTMVVLSFLGQYTKRSPVMAWKMAPISLGVWILPNIVQIIMSLGISIKSSILLYYLVKAFKMQMPWNKCDNEDITNKDVTCFNQSIHGSLLSMDCYHESEKIICPNITFQLPPTRYLWKLFYDNSPADPGQFVTFASYFFGFWTVIFLMLMRSVYSSIKLIYYCKYILIVYFIFALLFPIPFYSGAVKGMAVLFSMEKEVILQPQVWVQAAVHAVTVFPVTVPTIFAYSTRLTFKSSVIYDSMIVTAAGTVINFLFLLTSFGIMGIIADTLHVPVLALKASHTGIILGITPYILNTVPLGHLVMVLYCLVLNFVILVSECIHLTGIMQNLLDYFELGEWRTYFLIGYAFINLLMGFPLLTKTAFRDYHPVASELVLPTVVLVTFMLQTTVVFYLYGTSRLSEDIHFFLGSPPAFYWRVCWRLIPLITYVVLGAFIYQWIHEPTRKFNRKPVVVGCVVIAIALAIVPFFAIIMSIRYIGISKCSNVLKPTFNWGPPNTLLRRLRKKFNPQKHIPSQPPTTRKNKTMYVTIDDNVTSMQNELESEVPKLVLNHTKETGITLEEFFRNED